MTYLELFNCLQQTERHGSNFSSVLVAIANWKTTDHHVSVANGLYFVDVVAFDDGVETGVKVIEKIHNLKKGQWKSDQLLAVSCRGRRFDSHLQRRAFGGHAREAHDVTEVDGHKFERFRFHFVSVFELFGHVSTSKKN